MGARDQEREHQGGMKVQLISAGAAQGLVGVLRERVARELGADIEGVFGAVGLMQEKLLGGAPCDVVILTRSQIDALVQDGDVQAGSARDLGAVATGIAVVQGASIPDVATPAALRAALLDSVAIYLPDPVKSTAGRHFALVLLELGVVSQVAQRLRPYPNGATAMREMVQAAPGLAGSVIGCTQQTEILNTPGALWVAPLPKALGLATVYTAAVAARCTHPAAAQQLVELLAGADAATLRRAGGFSDAA